MVDTCTITRAGAGKGTFNNTTGQYDPPDRIPVYTGKCRIQDKSVIAGSSSSEVGERAVIVQGWELQLPVLDSGDVATNDVSHIDTCVSDPSLGGREFTVSARHGKSQATSRRLRVIEVTG